MSNKLSTNTMFESINANKGKGINMPQELIDEVVEEHKEKESKSKSNILDISHLDNFVANDGEVNINPKIMKAYGKKKAAKLEKEKKRLDKVVDHTDKLIDKANKKESTVAKVSPNRSKKGTKKGQTGDESRLYASELDYHCLNGNPKIVLKFIVNKQYEQMGNGFDEVFIDTSEMKEVTGFSTDHLKKILKTLKKKGFLEVKLSRKNGMRMISLPKCFHPRGQTGE